MELINFRSCPFFFYSGRAGKARELGVFLCWELLASEIDRDWEWNFGGRGMKALGAHRSSAYEYVYEDG